MFVRFKVSVILVRIIDQTANQLSCYSKLHWAKVDGGIGVEGLMKNSPAQPPMRTILRSNKVKIESIAGNVISMNLPSQVVLM